MLLLSIIIGCFLCEVQTNPVGAIVVSMETGLIIARGHTNPDHLLKHAIMECINQVAQSQGGGTFQKPSLLQTTNFAALQDSSFSQSRSDKQISSKKPRLESYLCSAYDVFTTVEPCVMWVCTVSVKSKIKNNSELHIVPVPPCISLQSKCNDQLI